MIIALSFAVTAGTTWTWIDRDIAQRNTMIENRLHDPRLLDSVARFIGLRDEAERLNQQCIRQTGRRCELRPR